MKRIKILPQYIASQIAAGEVVDRPASVVKELLENSVDAEASVIEIDIHKGGSELIRIVDDGNGIHKDDLPLAVAQHGTSKIREFTELSQLVSLGFRGEALASITSISDFSIISRQALNDSAWSIDNQGTIKPAAHPKGTAIEIRNIFHNVPVRRKFLKSQRTEFQHIEDIVKRIALSAFSTAIVLRHNDKQIINVKPADNQIDYLQRIGKVVGNHFIEHAYSVDVERLSMRLWGWALPAEESRAHADLQYFFLNGRMIKDKIINHAIRVAFQDVYECGRYPAYVLYLECEPATIDVNVHPTKHEVRFQEQRLVHDFVQYSLQKMFEDSDIDEQTESEQHLEGKTVNNTYTAQPYSRQSNLSFRSIGEQKRPYQATTTREGGSKALAFVEARYIVALEAGKLFIVDSIKAQGLIRYHLLKKSTVRTKPLLLPETIKTDVKMMMRFVEKEQQWAKYGVTIRQVSPQVLMVKTLPAWLHGIELLPLFVELVEKVTEDEIIQSLLSFSIINEELSKDEMNECLQALSIYSLEQLSRDKIVKLLQPSDLESLFK